LLFGSTWQVIERGMDAASQAVLASDSLGLFVYGVLNRVLIVTGLHHILNNIAWFLIGDYGGATGDLQRFFAGDPSAGAFMSGFFPVMMFGLPAACLAMYRAAAPDRRKAVGGLLFSIALTSFLTGVTEPIEFSFMFLAPVLFALHAVLTGLAMALMDLLGVRLGFGFSAGLFDYVLNFTQSTRPLLLFPIGVTYFAVYYALFRWFIVRLDLKTPGREAQSAAARALNVRDESARAWVQALGGAANLVSIDACTTRLRLVVADQKAIDEQALRALGARGFVRPSAETLQVVVGPVADQLASEIRGLSKAVTTAPEPVARLSAETLLNALGGPANVRELRLAASRLCVTVEDAAAVSASAIEALPIRGIARPTPKSVHVLIGPAAERIFDQMSPSTRSRVASAMP
jgi:N-acetylglucosamine PTS system EIICBA or EIICB component